MSAGSVRVLVVDDDDDMRYLLRAYIDLSETALEVTGMAGSGDEAIRMWRADAPDVIVLDIRMPTMSGLEAAQAILAEDPAQPIVLFSAYLHPTVLAVAEGLGVRACVEKNQLRELPEILERHARRD